MNILMVCLGNICRSPMAQGILESKLRKINLHWNVDSAGTSGWHNGESPDTRAVVTCFKYGVDISSQRSRKFTHADFNDFDLIFTMDKSNFDNVLSLANSSSDMQKVKLLLEFDDPNNTQIEVPDPYFSNNFDEVFHLLDQSMERIINKIQSEILAY
ncbi:MAG TPA: low molecular weight protein-tyrosine-phosphatase [Saprospiraceae bacterium]|nr:low molecular weight protein-tyrosine-phosphatase [Saprospiraceae bacterium]